jgi:large subunit ribosomal protein L9
MKVILNEFVQNLGDAGDQVVVASGYGRNFLLPRKLAILATPANQKTYDNNLKQRARKLSKMRSEAEEQKTRLEAAGILEFVRKSAEQGKLFGSVTSADVGAALAEKGFDIDKRRLSLAGPIKTLGETSVYIKLHPKVTAEVKVNVKAEEPPAAPAELAATEAIPGAAEVAADEAAGEALVSERV